MSEAMQAMNQAMQTMNATLHGQIGALQAETREQNATIQALQAENRAQDAENREQDATTQRLSATLTNSTSSREGRDTATGVGTAHCGAWGPVLTAMQGGELAEGANHTCELPVLREGDTYVRGWMAPLPSLETLFPRLQQIDGLLSINGTSALRSVGPRAFPALERVGAHVVIDSNVQLRSIEFPALERVGTYLRIHDNATLARRPPSNLSSLGSASTPRDYGNIRRGKRKFGRCATAPR